MSLNLRFLQAKKDKNSVNKIPIELKTMIDFESAAWIFMAPEQIGSTPNASLLSPDTWGWVKSLSVEIKE